MDIRKELYIGGRWITPAGDGVIQVIDSVTEELMGTVPRGGAAEVESAVTAANDALPAWSMTSVSERAGVLRAIAAGLAEREDELATLMAREVGTPIGVSHRVQVGLAGDVFRSMADTVEERPDRQVVGNSVLFDQPVGVVAAITPWNYPLYQLAAKLAPALGAGCTAILKPAGAAPLATFALAEIIESLGLPPGTVNLITGPGSEIGEIMARHDRVDMVSLTGSTRAGIRVGELAAGTVKKVALELGGKSAFIILEDSDLAKAMPVAVRASFVNNGQTCSALTRLIVPRSRLAEVEERLAELVGAMTVGDPLDPSTDLGPMVSAGQRDSVQDYISIGIAEGAQVITGGVGHPDGIHGGFFVKPTVLSDVTRDMRVAQEEIFGPVLVVLAAEDDDDAVAIANDSEYGLSGGVWSEDQARAISVARRLRTGQVAVNGGRFNVKAPFGGFRKSGVGRELGEHGLAEYIEVMAINLPAAADPNTVALAPGEHP